MMMKTTEEIRILCEECSGDVWKEIADKEWCFKEKLLKAIGPVTFMRGLSDECNTHNAKNRERQRILKELFDVKVNRCETCDSLDDCTCFCECGLPHDQCQCGWTEEDYKK